MTRPTAASFKKDSHPHPNPRRGPAPAPDTFLFPTCRFCRLAAFWVGIFSTVPLVSRLVDYFAEWRTSADVLLCIAAIASSATVGSMYWIGLYLAYRRGRLVRAVTTLCSVLVAVPAFVLSTVLFRAPPESRQYEIALCALGAGACAWFLSLAWCLQKRYKEQKLREEEIRTVNSGPTSNE